MHCLPACQASAGPHIYIYIYISSSLGESGLGDFLNVACDIKHFAGFHPFNLHDAKSHEGHEGARVAQEGGSSTSARNESHEGQEGFLFIILFCAVGRKAKTKTIHVFCCFSGINNPIGLHWQNGSDTY